MKVLLTFVFSFLFSVISVQATGDFYVKHVVEMKFDKEGKSRVEHRISLRNKFTKKYASKYILGIQNENPKNLIAWDDFGPIQISNTNPVELTFNRPVVGKDYVRHFSLRFEGNSAVHKGQVWEITLPKLSNPELVDSYQVDIIAPPEFGKLAYRNDTTAVYGNFQTMKFSLTYQLHNTSNKTQLLTAPWPADSHYQKVFYTQADPIPHNVRVDSNGDWQADYLVKPEQVLIAKVEGRANLSPGPTSNNKSAKNAYDYVLKNLNYDEQNRCLEFTDLFRQQATKLGINTRTIVGYAYTTQSQLRPLGFANQALHAWPEYWDDEQKSWISVDPTWGKTTGGVDYFSKLDFNHLAISRNLETNIVNIHMELTQYQEFPFIALETTWNRPWIVLPFIKNISSITKRNKSGQLIDGVPPFGRVDIPYEH